MWIISKSHRDFFFIYIFAIHSSSRHEKRCQMSLRLFSLISRLYIPTVIPKCMCSHYVWTRKNILYLFRVFRVINYYCSPFFYSQIEDTKKELNSLKCYQLPKKFNTRLLRHFQGNTSLGNVYKCVFSKENNQNIFEINIILLQT